jgi:hypothetical protein
VKRHHEVSGLHFEEDFMVLTVDGQVKKYDLREVSPALYRATAQEKMTFEISPSGYGIHWPLLDEDLSIDGLLGIVHLRQVKERRS